MDHFQSASGPRTGRPSASGRTQSRRLQRKNKFDGLLPNDDADQKLSVRGRYRWCEAQCGPFRSGKEARLAEAPGIEKRKNLSRRASPNPSQTPSTNRLTNSDSIVAPASCRRFSAQSPQIYLIALPQNRTQL